MDNLPGGSLEAGRLLKESMTRRLLGQSAFRGYLTLPGVPAMLDEYVMICARLSADAGRDFPDEERSRVRKKLQRELARVNAISPYSSINVVFMAGAGRPLRYQVTGHPGTLEGGYTHWISTREPPLFGTEPDARLLALANDATDPTTHRVLDIGGGTGRNALPLARRGHPVDVVELTEKFAEVIRADAERESLDVRVIVRDVFSTTDDLRRDYQLIVLSGVVSDFRATQQLRGLFELAAQCLAPGGRVLFNTFLVRDGHALDQVAREFGQTCHTCFFTRDELEAAAAELPLELVADDSVYDYEKAHLPEGGWPPTGWYENWVSGLEPFPVPREMSPLEMRWLVYQKTR